MLHGRPLSLSLAARPVRRAWTLCTDTFQRHPFLVKTISSAGGFAFGDLLMQLGSSRSRRRLRVDTARAAQMGAAGLVAGGPAGYLFIMLMEHINPSHSKFALGTKFALDQALGFVIWHAALCAIHEPHRVAMQKVWDGAINRTRQQPAAAKQA